jgi:itaconyl-CoA hydratase
VSGFFGYVRLRPGRYRERHGLAFEEFAPGQVFAHRPGADFTQQDNGEEALDTLNNAQLHYDARYAAATEWQRPLGVSTLTLRQSITRIRCYGDFRQRGSCPSSIGTPC